MNNKFFIAFSNEMLSIAGCSKDHMIKVLQKLGYEIQNKQDLIEPEKLIFLKAKIKKKNLSNGKNDNKSFESSKVNKKKKFNVNKKIASKSDVNFNSPFAVLQNMKFNLRKN